MAIKYGPLAKRLLSETNVLSRHFRPENLKPAPPLKPNPNLRGDGLELDDTPFDSTFDEPPFDFVPDNPIWEPETF